MRQLLRSELARGRSLVALGVVAMLAAACGSASSTAAGVPTVGASAGAAVSPAPASAAPATATPASATPAATPAPTPAPTGPAAFQLKVAGDPNVTGTWGKSFGIDCDNPTFDGQDILFFGAAPDGKAVVLITLKPGSIAVSERAGSGAAYTDREFQGTGVTTFDAATGAAFDSDVAEVPASGQKPGTLGTIKHVAGSVDCGNQGPGTSTVVASGAAPEGPVSGAFKAFRVACNKSAQYGDSVNMSAVIDAGTTPTFMIINLPANKKGTVFSSTESPAVQHAYAIAKTGSYTVSGTGAHVDADFDEVLPAGSAGPAHTIHLAGDVTCGATTGN